jgi:hypothetical protein
MKFLILTTIFTLGVISPIIYKNIILTQQEIILLPLVSLLVGYVGYRVKFKRKNSFKNFVYRNYIKFRWMVDSVNVRLKAQPENTEILPIQTKSIKLWKLLLRDDKSQISCSLGNRIRQVEKDNMLLILSPINQQDYQLTIMDVDNMKSCLYEIPMYSKLAEVLIEVFDDENEKRMLEGQLEKKQSIHNDLDKLISQQQEYLKSKGLTKA